MTLQATKTVREIAVEMPAATRLFEKLGIDYCCGGGRPLTEACASMGLEVEQVVASLEQIGETAHGPEAIGARHVPGRGATGARPA